MIPLPADLFWAEDPLPVPDGMFADEVPRLGSAVTPRASRSRARHQTDVPRARVNAMNDLTHQAAALVCRCKRGRRCLGCQARDILAVWPLVVGSRLQRVRRERQLSTKRATKA